MLHVVVDLARQNANLQKGTRERSQSLVLKHQSTALDLVSQIAQGNDKIDCFETRLTSCNFHIAAFALCFVTSSSFRRDNTSWVRFLTLRDLFRPTIVPILSRSSFNRTCCSMHLFVERNRIDRNSVASVFWASKHNPSAWTPTMSASYGTTPPRETTLHVMACRSEGSSIARTSNVAGNSGPKTNLWNSTRTSTGGAASLGRQHQRCWHSSLQWGRSHCCGVDDWRASRCDMRRCRQGVDECSRMFSNVTALTTAPTTGERRDEPRVRKRMCGRRRGGGTIGARRHACVIEHRWGRDNPGCPQSGIEVRWHSHLLYALYGL